MKLKMYRLGLMAGAMMIAAPAVAQDEEAVEVATEVAAVAKDVAEQADETADVISATSEAVETAAPAMEEPVVAPKPCELHVWPTENYLGMKMGLLSGFGAIGALIDHEAGKGKVTTIKDLMRDYLGPEMQMSQLESLDYVSMLGLDPDKYEVILQEPTPWSEDLKEDPELKAKTKAFNKRLKSSERVTDSENACYAELIATHIFYHKAMMYGSNLFAGWVFREDQGGKMVTLGKGQVKNPLEEFPPKDETMIEIAQAELRDAYSKDWSEYIEKKLKR